MAVEITKKAVDLRTLFNDVEEVYFFNTPVESAEALATLKGGVELPVLEDGVTFNTGEVEVTQIRLTTGAIWTSKAKRGDADISFNVASVASEITNVFFVAKTGEPTMTLGTDNYAGKAYNLSPKKVTGALVLPSQDKSVVLVLPKAEMYASFNAADGDNPAYFNVKVTPLENSEESELYILEKSVGE